LIAFIHMLAISLSHFKKSMEHPIKGTDAQCNIISYFRSFVKKKRGF
jgi:hypothetical protein